MQTDPGDLDWHLKYREQLCCSFSKQDKVPSSINYMEGTVLGILVYNKTIQKVLCVYVKNRFRLQVEINNNHTFHQMNV